MPSRHRFQTKDGRIVTADTPEAFFRELQHTEYLPPADLGRYLDLLQSRIAIMDRRDVDVGIPGTSIAARCYHAFASLLQNGWIHICHGALKCESGPPR
jgi:hypothetical protein